MKETIANHAYDYLERIGNLVRMGARRVPPVNGIQPVQLEALHYLSSCNRYSNTPLAVAEYLGLTKGTVSQTLSVLEANGLIEKIPDGKDRRVVRLVLTPTGEALLAEAIPPRVLALAMGELTEQASQEIVAALQGLLQAMQKANQLKSFGVCGTCRHHRLEADGSRWCGLTLEALQPSDAEKICREHTAPDEALDAPP
ncbi:MarR family winged helix-turn-helix transcriptional regulator [Methylotetracoccus oryzae]|uniref:MarR family winged helix-turn-helix transcriptional regulator n=1 Tax=Methylotetracoccus oryzae TaxID=1919059 RepID=UPI00111A7E0F|nr:MarR family winged helix-turn-helix transcriptional regulator [Methylotetracoccus oryzae]